MNEGTKTGIFWCIAVVMLAIAAFVAWPTSTERDSDSFAGSLLFEKFTDPLAAASMKIVTFDEEKGQLDTFEVRKDRDSGLWTIPSRSGYPADAVEHMKDAANAFVGLKILDIQTSNAEDHDDLGVAEPKLEDLEIGDEGVGRLVTFKDDSQQTLASLVIGDVTKDDEEKLYVRVPGQDPVYVVKFDESPLTTDFQKWIEDDLLKLSSIDIEDMEIRDYNASIGLGGQINLTSNYDAKVRLDGTDWKLDRLAEYTPDAPLTPKPVTPAEDEKLDSTKLNNIKNALDDLKIVDVRRKPEGMSATLRANQDLLTDKEAVGSLAQRGFYPIQRGPEYQILSANGELTVGLKDGIQYVMRFGNISGLTETEESDTKKGDSQAGSDDVSAGGVNRYLLVMTRVDESKFPAPELATPPETLEDLAKMLAPKEEPKPETLEPESGQPENPGDQPEGDDAEKADKPEDNAESSDDSAQPTEDDAAETSGEAADEKTAAEESGGEETKQDADSASETDVEQSGETETSGSGEASGEGEGQQESDQQQADGEQPTVDEQKPVEVEEEKEAEQEKSSDEAAASEQPADQSDEAENDQPEKAATNDAAPGAETDASEEKPKDELAGLTEEEKLERLDAEREKILKENQRKIDERNDKLAAAKRRVAELNARFADWYYVIPEDTYTKLRIKRADLFEKPEAETPAPGAAGPSLPNFQLPGGPGN